MVENPLFNKAFDFMIKNEGGYVNDPLDAGGETKWGISKRSYPNLDIKSLSKEDAKNIYRRNYWESEYDLLENQELSIRVFDMAVNSGHKNAHLLLQRAINACGGKISEDGIIGPQTVNQANSVQGGWLLERFRVERYNFYKRLADAYPARIKFLKGWMGRTYL